MSGVQPRAASPAGCYPRSSPGLGRSGDRGSETTMNGKPDQNGFTVVFRAPGAVPRSCHRRCAGKAGAKDRHLLRPRCVTVEARPCGIWGTAGPEVPAAWIPGWSGGRRAGPEGALAEIPYAGTARQALRRAHWRDSFRSRGSAGPAAASGCIPNVVVPLSQPGNPT